MDLKPKKQKELNNEERMFLGAVEKGDVAGAKRALSEATERHINKSCKDSLGRSALVIAIENENGELVESLLAADVELEDALLYAIREEYVEAVEMILTHQLQKYGEDYLQTEFESNTFTLDITPIILAGHIDNYEIIKMLLDRGYRIPRPHDLTCHCDDCLKGSTDDVLGHSRARINAYRALASPSLIALSSKDPILTAFELSWELRNLSELENEFKTEYQELGKICQQFSVDLLDEIRGSKELEVILNHDSRSPDDDQNKENKKLNRLKLAIKYKQKRFVSHPNCQQLLASKWYEGLGNFRRKPAIKQLTIALTICFLFPVLSMIYMVAPHSKFGKLCRKPFIKFLLHAASYMSFLGLLIMVSQRIENPLFFLFPFDETKKKELRGKPATIVEMMILCYVLGLIWSEIKQIWMQGALEYIHDMWNILDFVTNSLYMATFTLRLLAFIEVYHERAANNPYAYEERKHWDAYDPNLIAEALFAGANIFSSLKLIYIFTINPHLGPLQISLGRMVADIVKFISVYFLVLFSFACGLNHLYWYYAALRAEECEAGVTHSCDIKYRSFANLFEILQSLYWAVYGLVDLEHAHLDEPHKLTELIGKLMFGSYSMIAIIILLNLLIAMMSNSYQLIYSQADEEWKFARSRLWISYFAEGATVPPPFNIFPSPKSFTNTVASVKNLLLAHTAEQKTAKWKNVRSTVSNINKREIRYQVVIRKLISRYIMNKQRPQKDEIVSQDDVNELKQDISTFRFELMQVLNSNGFETPVIHQAKTSSKKDRMWKNLSVATDTNPEQLLEEAGLIDE
ncbi:transient receptor potential-gamma protein-like isoform X1 [Octopus sinensis]|uniref:Transient receptor potential-gamma protein-like isoform X1 n=1 Tax=Octopus sinensis TaxID=2607531 RepID=A0A7E6F975_9MOLL|nr:transient receptor potential-gamma protein-like isoform X1 [Octopus sinensis]XP_036364089.1 transient receptor potential-gamma protein-like isoform X1 [Octopus sinensis]